MTPRPPTSTLFPYTTLFRARRREAGRTRGPDRSGRPRRARRSRRSEEHTSELQSRRDLVCRLLLEKKNWRPGWARRVRSWRSGCGRVGCGAGALVRGDDLPQGLLALAVALGDGMRVESGVDLGLQGVGLGAGAGDVAVGPGDVAAGAVAAVKAGGDRSTLCAAVGVAQRGQRVVVARQQGVWVVEHAQPAVVQQRPSLPLGQHRTLVGGGELSSAGAVAFGRGAAR